MEYTPSQTHKIANDIKQLPLVPIVNNLLDRQSKNNKKTTPQVEIDKELRAVFPEQEYDEKELKEAKAILGTKTNSFSKAEIEVITAEIKYLAQTWLDDYERNLFQGFTLQELLHEKGGI